MPLLLLLLSAHHDDNADDEECNLFTTSLKGDNHGLALLFNPLQRRKPHTRISMLL